jgi:transposase InsO family protein
MPADSYWATMRCCGDCYDNAQAETLWSRLKTEIFEGYKQPVFADLADAQRSIVNYFDY